jgi:hypothetical protein
MSAGVNFRFLAETRRARRAAATTSRSSKRTTGTKSTRLRGLRSSSAPSSRAHWAGTSAATPSMDEKGRPASATRERSDFTPFAAGTSSASTRCCSPGRASASRSPCVRAAAPTTPWARSEPRASSRTSRAVCTHAGRAGLSLPAKT